MRLRLYYDPGAEFRNDPVNGDFASALGLLDELKDADKAQIEIISTAGWSDERRWEVYSEACVPAMWKKFRIRRIFGTRNYSASNFAKGVPALLVDEEDSRISPADVYPHHETGRLITIADYLRSLLG